MRYKLKAKHFLFTFLILFISSFHVLGNQIETIDSLKNLIKSENNQLIKGKIFTNLCKLYNGLNQDSAIFYGNKSIELLNNNKASKNLLYQANYNLGVVYLEADLDQSRNHLKKSLNYALQQGSDSILAANYLVFSTYYSRIPKLDSSIFYNVLASEIFQKRHDSLALAYCYYTSMSNYNDLKNTEKTLEYGLLCYEIAKIKKIDGVLSHISIALGFTYTRIEGKEEQANKFINEAIQLAEAKNDYLLLSHIYLTLGAQNFKNKKYNDAILDYKKAYSLSINNNDELNASRSYSRLAMAYYELNYYDKAALFFKKDLEFNRNTVIANKRNYLHLAFIYANNDKNQHALYVAKYDSISKMIISKNSEELLVKYETSEKERQIELLKLKELENELIIQKNNFRNIVIISTFTISVLLLLMLLFRNNIKRKLLNKNLEIEKQKARQSEFELHQKENELSIKINSLKDNNKVITDLKNKLENVTIDDKNFQSIITTFDQSYVSDKQWDNIINQYQTIDKDFIQDLETRYSNISKNDVKLSILMKLNYSNSGMAEILNITIEGVKKAKQRLKKKIS
jgi:tetratricopeptide (TPR) repeat protein